MFNYVEELRPNQSGRHAEQGTINGEFGEATEPKLPCKEPQACDYPDRHHHAKRGDLKKTDCQQPRIRGSYSTNDPGWTRFETASLSIREKLPIGVTASESLATGFLCPKRAKFREFGVLASCQDARDSVENKGSLLPQPALENANPRELNGKFTIRDGPFARHSIDLFPLHTEFA